MDYHYLYRWPKLARFKPVTLQNLATFHRFSVDIEHKSDINDYNSTRSSARSSKHNYWLQILASFLLGKTSTLNVTICLETFQDRYLPSVLLTAVNACNSLPCPSRIFEGKRPLEKSKHRWKDKKIKYMLNTRDDREWTGLIWFWTVPSAILRT